MQLSTFWIKRGDRLPTLVAALQLVSGAAIDLTGCTVRFTMRQFDWSPAVVNAACTVLDPLTGAVEYAWAEGDTDVAGDFQGEFEITDGDGKKRSVPNDRNLTIKIREDLG